MGRYAVLRGCWGRGKFRSLTERGENLGSVTPRFLTITAGQKNKAETMENPFTGAAQNGKDNRGGSLLFSPKFQSKLRRRADLFEAKSRGMMEGVDTRSRNKTDRKSVLVLYARLLCDENLRDPDSPVGVEGDCNLIPTFLSIFN